MTITSQPEDLADAAGLEYVFDDGPGLRRRRRGRGFSYHDDYGDPIDDATTGWIRSLAIPPAWSDVWISPERRGHILATGYDEAGRKQYIYHPDWEAAAGELKFERMAAFGRYLPRLRRSVLDELRHPRLDRRKVTALAVGVLDSTLIRVGNDRYTRLNGSYGLTTLTVDHADVSGSFVRFEFAGKGGIDQMVAMEDRRLAGLISRCQDVSGETLFSYQSQTGPEPITAADLNRFIAGRSRLAFTAKDFRTWGASATAVEALATTDEPDLNAAVDVAAERLGNTRAVCRASYIHPRVGESLDAGQLQRAWKTTRTGKWLNRSESTLNRILAG